MFQIVSKMIDNRFLDMYNHVPDGEVSTLLNGSSTAAAQTEHMCSVNIYP